MGNGFKLTIICTFLYLTIGCQALVPPPAAVATASVQAAAPQTAAPGITKTVAGKVVAIADGDTLTVLDSANAQHRIRLQGIDAPESNQAFGTRSKQYLSELVFGKEVTVEYDKRDRYGRTLGKVILGGQDACLEQVRAGVAWHYKYYENEQPPEDRRAYAQAEVEARAAKRGLWVDPDPIPPWDFRQGRRGGASEGGGSTGETGAPPAGGAIEPRSARGTPPIPVREPEADTAYITRTGAKYHRLNCQYLRRSRIPVALKDAKQHYAPCSVCRPPE